MFLFRDTGLPRAPHSKLLRRLRVRSFTGCRGISPPKHPISALPRKPSPFRLTLESFRVEPAVTGLDWPFTTKRRLEECFARQQPCGPPSLVRATSSYPRIDRPASGFNAVTTGPLKTLPLTPKKKMLRAYRFPYDYEVKLLSLTTTKNSLARVSRRTMQH